MWLFLSDRKIRLKNWWSLNENLLFHYLISNWSHISCIFTESLSQPPDVTKSLNLETLRHKICFHIAKTKSEFKFKNLAPKFQNFCLHLHLKFWRQKFTKMKPSFLLKIYPSHEPPKYLINKIMSLFQLKFWRENEIITNFHLRSKSIPASITWPNKILK